MKLFSLFLATAAIVLAQDDVSATAATCVPEPTTPPAAEPAETAASTTAVATVIVSTTDAVGSTTSEAVATACEPHGDHWHCPSGVPEPTTPPSATATGEHDDEHDHDHEATAATCEPHVDHWHCPSGVAEPTTPPPATIVTLMTANVTAIESAAPTSSQFDGAAMAAGPLGSLEVAVIGIFGLLFV
ncbi:hypothetical protein N0V90_012403 [Kalmusia sp. IMI 367209]|nr:hypothetical protein N0V90_012403 [Kalmusia sp. IMI 367209]